MSPFVTWCTLPLAQPSDIWASESWSHLSRRAISIRLNLAALPARYIGLVTRRLIKASDDYLSYNNSIWFWRCREVVG